MGITEVTSCMIAGRPKVTAGKLRGDSTETEDQPSTDPLSLTNTGVRLARETKGRLARVNSQGQAGTEAVLGYSRN